MSPYSKIVGISNKTTIYSYLMEEPNVLEYVKKAGSGWNRMT